MIRHLIPSFPLYGWIPVLLMVWGGPLLPLGFVTYIAEVYLFYPYLSAWIGRVGYGEQLPAELGIILSVCHWLIVYGLCYWSTRRLRDGAATGVSLGIMAASVILAYLVLGGLGYTVRFFIE